MARRQKKSFARQRDADMAAAGAHRLQETSRLAEQAREAISNANRNADEAANQKINLALQASFFISRYNIVL